MIYHLLCRWHGESDDRSARCRLPAKRRGRHAGTRGGANGVISKSVDPEIRDKEGDSKASSRGSE